MCVTFHEYILSTAALGATAALYAGAVRSARRTAQEIQPFDKELNPGINTTNNYR